jgi:MFS family permease
MASSTAALGYPSFPVTILAGIFLVLALMPGASSAHSVSQDSYHNNPLTYLFFSFVMSFGTISFILGVFAFKYGKKRTRIYSVPMMASGTVIWALWFYFNFVAQADYPDDTVFSIIHWVAAPLLKPVMALLGAGLGLALALVIFLNSIVRA